jgi:uncharacterized membrane protein (DUF485 family)
MKAFRIVQIILLVLVIGYLFWLHGFNPTWIEIPLLFSLPAAVVIGIALVVGWLVGWLSGRNALWGKGREIKKLNKRIAELESQTMVRSGKTTEESAAPIIPDRSGNFQSNSEFENI